MARSEFIRRCFGLRSDFGRCAVVSCACFLLSWLTPVGADAQFEVPPKWFEGDLSEELRTIDVTTHPSSPLIQTSSPTFAPAAVIRFASTADDWTDETPRLVAAHAFVSSDDLYAPSENTLPADESVCDLSCFDSGETCSVPPLKYDRCWSAFDEGRTVKDFICNDLRVGIHEFWDDAHGLIEMRNLVFLGTGLGLSLSFRDSVDEDVREWAAEHPHRWGSGSEVMYYMGTPEVQIPVLMSLYGLALHLEDEDLMRFSRLTIRAYALTGISTVLVKAIADTDRPNSSLFGGRYGFPSGHASTSFALAATVEEFYGPRYGIPAYLMAGLISFSRIDQQDHDLSDVVFGAFLGYAIGKSVAGRELRGDSRIQFYPWANPVEGSGGLLMEYTY